MGTLDFIPAVVVVISLAALGGKSRLPADQPEHRGDGVDIGVRESDSVSHTTDKPTAAPLIAPDVNRLGTDLPNSELTEPSPFQSNPHATVEAFLLAILLSDLERAKTVAGELENERFDQFFVPSLW